MNNETLTNPYAGMITDFAYPGIRRKKNGGRNRKLTIGRMKNGGYKCANINGTKLSTINSVTQHIKSECYISDIIDGIMRKKAHRMVDNIANRTLRLHVASRLGLRLK